MFFHYVEDNAVDAQVIRKMAEGADDLSLTTSRGLDDIASHSSETRLDGVLIDIYRPDTISIENDIERVRKVSPAPIAFVTGGEVGDLRARAIQAGAEGVFSKAALSPAIIQEVFHNAAMRRRPSLGDEASNEPAQGFLDALDYVTSSVATTADLAVDRRASVPPAAALLVADAATALRRNALRARAGGACIPVTEMLVALDRRIAERAHANDVTITYAGEWRAASEIGAGDLDRLGIQHLLLALIELARSRTYVAVDPGEGAPASYGRTITVSLDDDILAPGAGRLAAFDVMNAVSFEGELHLRIAADCFDRAGVTHAVRRRAIGQDVTLFHALT